MKIMGIDYGDSRVGIALSDTLGFSAHGYKTLPNKVYSKLLDSIVDISKENDVSEIVIGMPKNLNGTLGIRAEITQKFAEDLKMLLPDIVFSFQDERLTTVEASAFLNETNTRGKNRKNIIDTVSAEIILQTYLDCKANKSNGGLI